MITLKDKSTNRWLGQISYAQLKFLNDELLAEHKDDQDYKIDRDALDTLKARGADLHLAAILDKAMGDKEEIAFYWIKS
ncbi:MAG: hypothetical protein ABL859_00600 [Methylotenera sp.]|uniref:hypothetical protein n=1 Tax=Methylotenera sp. TaxID=2051956 RepID=UPI0017D5E10A|nr:hypothetical protein [Methylotenera sp.]NOU24258.1 galactosyldiacylglycerol synthase [Methylotenera sp.]